MNAIKNILIISLLFMSLIPNTTTQAQPTRNFTLIGHRGAAADAPENTIASIKRALELGVDRIEIDVHMTKDGKIAVIHDRTLNRTTSGTGEVRHQNLSDIRQLDAGSWFSPSFAGEKVPSLDEVIETVAGKCMLMIEVKEHSGYTPGIELAVAEIIRQHQAGSWCVAISLRHKVIKNFHKLAPDIRLHRSFVGKIPWLPLYLGAGISFKGLNHYPYVEEFNLNKDFISPCTVKKATKQGKKINVWTVDDPEQAKNLIQRGANGIITNCPKRYIN